ncbi:MAG: hypothetical protein KAQ98_13840 [Bacteriovoracaceae bacterium]|nr:hypothetical protein [Bacteriovoracaceae bacterium]
MNNKKVLKKRKKREEKKRLGKGNTDLKKGFTNQEKKKGRLGLYLIGGMAILAALFAFFQLNQWN